MSEVELRAKVVGAGSIGNHLTHALRTCGVAVTIVDVDQAALDRTKSEIYPERYGSFDDSIRLAHPDEIGDLTFDLCVIGTPPDTHLALATLELQRQHSAILIEKPLASPGSHNLSAFVTACEASSTRVMTAYNQRLKKNTAVFLEKAKNSDLGSLISIAGRMREDWAGILKAHPWLSDATQSYLGHTSRGGGALYEHSHAIDFALFIAHELGQGRPHEVKARLDKVEHDSGSYDTEANLSIKMSSGLIVEVDQDLHTWPADKSLDAQFENGSLRWEMHSDRDSVIVTVGNEIETIDIPKTRPDDFLPEIRHVVGLLQSSTLSTSPLDVSEVSYTSWTLEAALASSESGDWVTLDKVQSFNAN
jgi:predicted dehydrogenase